MLVSLPMYDLPELRDATDQWWATLARSLSKAGVTDVPKDLARDTDRETVWRAPDLVLTQTCGYPLTHAFDGILTAIAAPDYDAEGCGGGRYRSAFVVRNDDRAHSLADLRGRRVAANSADSQSGCNCLRAAIAPLARGGQFFSDVVWTGGHRDSLAAVASGRADIAALDGVTFALIGQVASSEIADVRILGWSAEAPALPYVTRRSADDDLRQRLQDGLANAVADPTSADARAILRIKDLLPVTDAEYRPIVDMRVAAEHAGYAVLA
jgi:ABC-type phosphate/phosphonate transport system substrate-binding protein